MTAGKPTNRLVVILSAGALLGALIPVVHAVSRDVRHDHNHVTADHVHLPADPASIRSVAPTLDRTGWRVTLSQPGADPGVPVDGDRRTAWRSRAPGRHTITVDLGEPTETSALVYTPPVGDAPRITHYEVRLGDDGEHWGPPVNRGTLADDATPKTLSYATATSRFIQLSTDDAAFDVAEIDVLGRPVVADLGVRGEISRAPKGQGGRWSEVRGFPVVPVAAALLPDRRLLTWSAYAPDDWGGEEGRTQTAEFNLDSDEISDREVSETGHDMFCPGTSLLADGRLLVSGGSNAERSSTFDLFSDAWEETGELNQSRGYQGQVTLADGRALVIGGSWSGGEGDRPGEVFDPESNEWRLMPGIDANELPTDDPRPDRAQDHIWMFPLSGDRLLAAGPAAGMHWISLDGDGELIEAGHRGADAMNGNAVMYDEGRILAVGGSAAYDEGPGHAGAVTIDVTGQTPRIQPAGEMAVGRTFTNSVAMPDGTVMVLGGQTVAAPFTDDDAVLEPELWDPRTRRFTVLEPMAVPRTYHSVALLLPDGRVFVGGGGLCGDCGTNHADGQILTPPYLLNPDGSARSRPTITSAPREAGHGERITVSTRGAVRDFALVRTSSVTHSLNNDQRRLSLRGTTTAGGTELRIPSDPGTAPPGYYMLFAMDQAGTPSEAVMIRIS